MNAVTSLIAATARCIRGEVSASPMARASKSPQPQPAITSLAASMNNFTSFVRSPIVSATSLPASSIDAIAAAFADTAAQSLAGVVTAKLDHLQNVAAYRSVMNAAVVAVLAEHDGDMSVIGTEAVKQKLRELADQVDDQIAIAREDKAEHDRIVKATRARYSLVRTAVSAKLNGLIIERDALVNAIESAQRATAMGIQSASRFSVLRAAGLSEEAIAKAEPDAISPDAVFDRRRARIQEIEPVIARLKTFGASPTFDASLLAGMGFDAEIALAGVLVGAEQRSD